MNSPERPFETLIPSEKDVFKVCADIIGWNPQSRKNPEIMELRDRATTLFEKVKHVDLSYNDSYYKYTAEAKALREEFDRIKEEKKNHIEDVYIDLRELFKNGRNFEALKKEFTEKLSPNTEVSTFFYWVPPDQDEPHTDQTSIWISPSEMQPGEYIFIANELFDPSIFEGSSQIKGFYGMLSPEERESVKLSEYIHKYGEEDERWDEEIEEGVERAKEGNEGQKPIEGYEETFIKIKEVSKDKACEWLNRFIDFIDTNPRKLKEDAEF